MSGLKREDEHRLHALKKLADTAGRDNLPEDDLLYLMYLEDRYAFFIEEGMRKLRGETTSNEPSVFSRFIFRKSSHALPSSRKGNPGRPNKNDSNSGNSDERRLRAEQNSSSSQTERYATPSDSDGPGSPSLRGSDICSPYVGNSGTTVLSSSVESSGGRGVNGDPSPSTGNSTNATTAHVDAVASVIDDSQLVSVPCTLTPPPQSLGKLWTWITDDLVVGGIPYAADSSTDTAAHLQGLREQCAQRDSVIAAVVNCLEMDETVPDGFAVARDWERLLNVVTFFFVPFFPRSKQANAEPPTDATLEELLTICNNIKPLLATNVLYSNGQRGDSRLSLVSSPTLYSNDSIPSNSQNNNSISNGRYTGAFDQRKRKVVYVYCKTGLSRAWVFVVSYLMSAYCLEFNEADAYLKALRDFLPSETQVTFAKRFADFLACPRIAERTDDEDRYLHVLAEVLSLPPRFRQRLLLDMEKLT